MVPRQTRDAVLLGDRNRLYMGEVPQLCQAGRGVLRRQAALAAVEAQRRDVEHATQDAEHVIGTDGGSGVWRIRQRLAQNEESRSPAHDAPRSPMTRAGFPPTMARGGTAFTTTAPAATTARSPTLSST